MGRLGHEGGALMDGISDPIKVTPQSSLTPSPFQHVRRQDFCDWKMTSPGQAGTLISDIHCRWSQQFMGNGHSRKEVAGARQVC